MSSKGLVPIKADSAREGWSGTSLVWLLSCSAKRFGSHPEDSQGAGEGFEIGTGPDQVCISGGTISLAATQERGWWIGGSKQERCL